MVTAFMDSITPTKTINLLWTGGWDSTFSLLILMDKNVIIQPYYIIDKQRTSYKKEIETMDNIRAAIYEKYPDKLRSFLPTKYTNLDEIEIDEEIYNKYQNLRRDASLGTQYYWIASYAKKLGINDFQLSVQKHLRDEDSTVLRLLTGYIRKTDDGIIRPYWEPQNLSDDLDISIFSYFHFPIFDYTKLDMSSMAKKDGYYDILNLSWFCHSPIKTQPCGICKPCIIAVEEGLSDRLPSKALRRYKYRGIYTLYYKTISKIKRYMKR